MSAPPDILEKFREFLHQKEAYLKAFAASQPLCVCAAEDLLHEAYEKALRRILRDEKYHSYNWLPWICSLIKWAALEKWRRNKKSPIMLANDSPTESGEEILCNTEGGTESPDIATLRTELRQLVTTALNRMDNDQERQCLELLYFDSENHQTLIEVAQTLKIKPNTVRKVHQRAKNSLKEKLRLTAPEIKSSAYMSAYES